MKAGRLHGKVRLLGMNAPPISVTVRWPKKGSSLLPGCSLTSTAAMEWMLSLNHTTHGFAATDSCMLMVEKWFGTRLDVVIHTCRYDEIMVRSNRSSDHLLTFEQILFAYYWSKRDSSVFFVRSVDRKEALRCVYTANLPQLPLKDEKWKNESIINTQNWFLPGCYRWLTYGQVFPASKTVVFFDV